MTLHGKYIPEDTVIGVNCWVVNRDKAIFGPDAHSFRPERWIESDPKVLTKMRTNMFTVSYPFPRQFFPSWGRCEKADIVHVNAL